MSYEFYWPPLRRLFVLGCWRERDAITAGYRRQHPQLEGKVDELAFGTEQVRPASYFRVSPVAGGEVDLLGDAVHGVTPGSVWSIRTAGARGLDDGDEIAMVRVESVRPATSRARLVEGAGGDEIRGGQRAFLRRQQLPEPGLRLAISAPEEKLRDSARLADLVADSKLLKIAGTAETAADVLIRCLAPRLDAGPEDPCPGLGPLPQWTWTAVGRDGRLALRPRPEPADFPGLVQDLVRLARFRQLLEIENPDRASRLRGRVRLRVKRRQGTDAGPPRVVAAEPEPGAGMVVLPEGEGVEIEVENGYDQPVWVTVVQFGSDGAIELVMPHPAHAPQLVRGGAGKPDRASPGSSAELWSEFSFLLSPFCLRRC